MMAFWIASGNRYAEEARKSMESLKRHMPDLHCCLCTTEKVSHKAFDSVMKLDKREHRYWYLDSVRYFNQVLRETEAKRLLYLDTDTYVCEDILDLFALLDRFDFVGAHAPGRQTANTVNDLPAAFPEINVGVQVFRNAPIVEALFRGWQARYEATPKLYGNNDQGALREALWNWTGRLYVLPPEYNMRWQFGGFARYPVKILHGRGDHEAVAQKLNAKAGMRGWDRGTC